MSLVVALLLHQMSHGQPGKPIMDIEKQKWIHGSSPCTNNKDDGLQVVGYDESTYIIRQNKCVHYEAPFLYLFVGADKALLVDTGAEASEDAFPLYKTVMKILTGLKGANGKRLSLTVIHSHGHDDHYAGDVQFKNDPTVQLVPPNKESIIEFFNLNWPEGKTEFDLGQRKLTIIPIPGHDEASIAVYDEQTGWLLTGDTVYPGRLYIRNWSSFQSSISRLYEFSKTHPVSYLMGNHLEMTTTSGIDYPTGTTYQPNEHTLPLKVSVLKELHDACNKMGDQLTYQVHPDFILVPK